MEFCGERAVALTGRFRRRVYENSDIHVVMAFFKEERITPSVRLSATKSHQLNRLSDFHEIQHKSFSQQQK
jgi:hypothetical protein